MCIAGSVVVAFLQHLTDIPLPIFLALNVALVVFYLLLSIIILPPAFHILYITKTSEKSTGSKESDQVIRGLFCFIFAYALAFPVHTATFVSLVVLSVGDILVAKALILAAAFTVRLAIFSAFHSFRPAVHEPDNEEPLQET
jgi:hypothetical protein